MQIITLGRVGGIGEGDDHIYQGNASLLRFAIGSPDDFFEKQLPWIVSALEIDIRQIMHLELSGDGQSGLDQASILISTEDPAPAASKADLVYEKLRDAPSRLPSDSSDCYDILRNRLIEFISYAPSEAKRRFIKDCARKWQANQNKAVQSRRAPSSAGYVFRVRYGAGSPPSIAEWRNVLLHCSERLRSNFLPERLTRLTFTAIPNSEQSYQAEAELLLPASTRTYRTRSELRFRRPKREAGPSTFVFETVPPEQKLSQAERNALDTFDRLGTRQRLDLWNKQLSKFFS
jgi:hypothetical protein